MSEYVIEVEYDTLNGTFSQKRREEIVRCRDCAICHRDEVGMWCCLCGTGFYRRPTGESDFCSKGERSADDRD